MGQTKLLPKNNGETTVSTWRASPVTYRIFRNKYPACLFFAHNKDRQRWFGQLQFKFSNTEDVQANLNQTPLFRTLNYRKLLCSVSYFVWSP